MCYNALKNSTVYTLEYREDSSYTEVDFIIVNYHHVVNNWMSESKVLEYNKPVFCIVTEISLHSNPPYGGAPPYFTHYIILDPTIAETSTIHGFGRPLNHIEVVSVNPTIPTIGMFGFATDMKYWTDLIEVVNREFDEAIIRINIPHATYVPDWMRNNTVNEIMKVYPRLKPKVRVELTDIYYSDTELINWCAANTINCFFYYRDTIFTSGLAAVTDQAIIAGKPILVTKDKTFRHLQKYIQVYPEIGIREAIDKTLPGVLRMREDWSAENFRKKFEAILVQDQQFIECIFPKTLPISLTTLIV
jgi:hypothetical protein